VFLLSVAINGVAFVVSAAFKTERFYDTCGSLTYLILCLTTHQLVTAEAGTHAQDWRRTVGSAAVAVWAARLGCFFSMKCSMVVL
jgi:steroid 5-alpha reductase family enzyme